MDQKTAEATATSATEALRKIHAADQAKGDLLSELLGALAFYANHGGKISYICDGKRRTADVSELLVEYRTKRDQVSYI